MVFLKGDGDKYTFASHYYPGIPATPSAALQNESNAEKDTETLAIIIDQMCRYAEDTTQDKDQRLSMMHRLWMSEGPQVHKTAVTLLGDDYSRIHDAALFTLIREKDKAYVSQAQQQVLDALRSETNLPYEGVGNLVLALLQEFPEDSLPILMALKNAKNSALRSQIAYAARDTRTTKAVPYLLPLVDDPDSEVAGNAMHSLGSLTDHLDWRPTSKEAAEWRRCQTEWHTYAATLAEK